MGETIGAWMVGQSRIIEKFGYKLIKRKRKELCQRCKRRWRDPDIDYHNCLLLPITSEGGDCSYFSAEHLAGGEGFEPSLTGPGPAVLPLDYPPATDVMYITPVVQSKSRPLPGLLKGILPSIVAMATPQKAAEIGKLIQSQLSNPQLCDQSLAQLELKYHVLRYPPNILLNYHTIPPLPSSYLLLPTTLRRPLLQAVSAPLSGHSSLDDATETAWHLTAPLTPPTLSADPDNETAPPTEAALTLPESVTEVALC